MSQPQDLFGTALADIATRLSRQALQSDPVLAARLAQLQGNVVELQCTVPAATWHLQIEADQVRTVSGPAPHPQAVVRGSLPALSRWLLPGGGSADLEISGDQVLLMELADLLKSFSPDLAQPLNQLLGPELAGSLIGGAELGLQALQSLLEGAGRTVQKQATDTFVQRPQLNEFLDGVDELRLRVDRLAARIDAAARQRRDREAKGGHEH